MKTLILMVAILLATVGGYTQESKITEFTDFDIAYALLGRKADKFDEILQRYEIAYWVTQKEEGKFSLYVSYDNSVRLWKVEINDIYRYLAAGSTKVADDVVEVVFVRYRHSNINDLKHFTEYEVPKDEEHRKFEKSMGVDISHLKIFQD